MDDDSPDLIADLVARAAEGDQSAWRDLVERCAPRLHAVLRVQCRDEDLAEEIVQSTFCTVVRKLPEYREGGRFQSWLMRIAMNRLRDEMRRRSRQARPTDAATMVDLAGEVEEPGVPAELPRGPLLRCLERLSEADREIVYLRHVGGLSFKELAEALETPLGTLLARHHRALKKLRGLLLEAGVEVPE